NHKDWRAEELITLLKRAGGDHLGICLDVGNSISLLEDPMEVVETLAPRAFTTHFKDMAVEEYRDGFSLSEVPLGQGLIDLPRVRASPNPGPLASAFRGRCGRQDGFVSPMAAEAALDPASRAVPEAGPPCFRPSLLVGQDPAHCPAAQGPGRVSE